MVEFYVSYTVSFQSEYTFTFEYIWFFEGAMDQLTIDLDQEHAIAYYSFSYYNK